MKKDIFGKWKKGAITGYDDDHQPHEGKIILDRMALIISSDEVKKKDTRPDFLISTGDSSAEVDKSEPRAQETAINDETSKDNLYAAKNSEANPLSLKTDKAMADEDEISYEFQNKKLRPVEKHCHFFSQPKGKESHIILIVEDEPVTQKLIKKILEERGYGVVFVGDGIDALMELGKRHFDLILSDLSMPNLDGFKLLDFINMKEIRTPIIFVTGSDDVEDEIKVLALGAKDYIRKPINRDLLLLRVSKALHESAL